MLPHIPPYRVSVNPEVLCSWFRTHSNHCSVIQKCCADCDATIKINTLMVSFCFESWIYYEWDPEKQTHAWFPPDVLGGSRSWDGNNATAIIKRNGKFSACHIFPRHIHQRAACKGLDTIYDTYPRIWRGVIWTFTEAQILPFVICWQLINSHSSHDIPHTHSTVFLSVSAALKH